MDCCNENLLNSEIKWQDKKSLCIVVCSKGYPDEYEKNILIKDINNIKLNNNEYCYHAGTKKIDNQIYSIGGRVLNYVSLANSFKESRDSVIKIVNSLNWKNGFFRKDIGYKVIDE